jgi:phage terminase small subunit
MLFFMNIILDLLHHWCIVSVMAKKSTKPVDYSKPLKNRRYEDFCQFYLKLNNATQAAIQAKYSKKTAGSKGTQLLQIVSIKLRLDYLKCEIAEKCGVTAEMLAQEYKKLAFSNMQDFEDKNGKTIPLHKLPRDVAAAIQTIDAYGDFKLHSKEKALDSLGKHIGFFEKDNEQHQIVVKETLTEEELKRRLAVVEAAGNGIDTNSIG